MSESEKFEAQGRAHAALKLARSNAATIGSELQEYAKRLQELNGLIYQFVTNPEAKENFFPISTHVKQTMQSLETERMVRLVDDFVTERRREQDLKKRIEDF